MPRRSPKSAVRKASPAVDPPVERLALDERTADFAPKVPALLAAIQPVQALWPAHPMDTAAVLGLVRWFCVNQGWLVRQNDPFRPGGVVSWRLTDGPPENPKALAMAVKRLLGFNLRAEVWDWLYAAALHDLSVGSVVLAKKCRMVTLLITELATTLCAIHPYLNEERSFVVYGAIGAMAEIATRPQCPFCRKERGHSFRSWKSVRARDVLMPKGATWETRAERLQARVRDGSLALFSPAIVAAKNNQLRTLGLDLLRREHAQCRR